ncbi:MAG: 4Fe-4S binding protein [Pseudomonadota bacterium]
MKEKIIQRVKELFDSGKIKGFAALRRTGDHISPFLFTNPDQLKDLSLGDKDRPGDARYPLAKLLSKAAREYPQDVFAILVRGCDERALWQLIRDARVNPLYPRQIVMIGFSCPPELALECECHKPWPDSLVVGDKTPGVKFKEDNPGDLDLFDQIDLWMDSLNKCLKCFGCRNVCPVCGCLECTIEREVLVPQRELPPDPSFLITRAVHMVDRCVYCGLCEQACPAGIPLKALYRMAARALGEGQSLPGLQRIPLSKGPELFAVR